MYRLQFGGQKKLKLHNFLTNPAPSPFNIGDRQLGTTLAKGWPICDK